MVRMMIRMTRKIPKMRKTKKITNVPVSVVIRNVHVV